MKREIKFRAWDGKKMVEVLRLGLDNYKTLVDEGGHDGYAETDDKLEIMQFTGLLDKNGKEIYEGDITNSLYRGDGCKGLYEVVWDKTAFRVKRRGNHQQIGVSITMADLTRCEVIGNIYEDKELLEK